MNKLDKLFSKKLAEHSSKPSERANELFNSRMAKQKKVVFWTPTKRNFAAAASLTILGGIGFYASLDQKKVELAQNETRPKVVVSEVPKTIIERTPRSIAIEKADITVAKQENIAYKVMFDKVMTPASLDVKVDNVASTEYENKLKSLSTDESIDYLNPKAALAITRPDTRALQPIEEATADEFKGGDDTFIIISPLNTYASNEVWEIPSILDQPSLDNALILEDHQERLLTKIYDEVKQLKKGQHLDLSKFGFKSLEDMALSEEGFIVTETKKIRSKFQWLKSKIYN